MTDHLPASPPGAEPLANVSVVEHDVRAPAGLVYDTFLDRGRWLPTFVREDVVVGDAGAVGAVAKITSRLNNQVLQRFERILLVEPGKRRVIASWIEGQPVVCLIDFHVHPVPTGARFTFTIHAVFSGFSIDEAAAFGAATQAQISKDFVRLRDCAEQLAQA
jgi:hypothetical protein